MISGLQTFWWFLVLIGTMILLHELGHYLVARLFDVHVEAFSFGFGPRLFGFRRGETDFRFCAFLLGGYVKMAGEQPGEIANVDPQTLDPRSFPAKPRWQRLCIIFAGPAVNFVLAVAILTGLFMHEYPKQADPPNPIVGHLVADGPAAKAGILEGDRVVEVDGQSNPTFEDIRRKELVGVGRAMKFVVERDGQRHTFDVTPVTLTAQGPGTTGWDPQMAVTVEGPCCGVDAIDKAGIKKGDTLLSINNRAIRTANDLIDEVEKSKGAPIPVVYKRDGQEHQTTVVAQYAKDKDSGTSHWRIGAQLQPQVEIVQLSFRDALSESLDQNGKNALMLYKFLQGIIEQRMSPKSIDGPIGIGRLAGQAARESATSYLSLMAMVSLNLAVVNLLPIPLLDGGGILMLLIEMLMQRDLSLRVKEGIIKVGFAFLMMVIVFVLYNDITKALPGG
jgi:regulator of sigma E protease